MNTVQVLLLVVSGAGALYAASDWSRDGTATAVADAIVAPAVRSPSSAPAPGAAAASADPFALRARAIPGGEAGAFGTLSFVPAPPAPPPVVAPPPPPPPPPPTAPPLPFTFVGMVEQGAATPQAYIAKGDVLLIVAAGDVIDNSRYRVEKLLPTAVVLTFLPLGQQQTLKAPGVTP